MLASKTPDVKWSITAARDLPTVQRRLILGALIVISLSLALADYRTPEVQFEPLVFLLVVASTAVGGLRFGMTYALVSATLFTLSEQPSGHPVPDFGLAANLGIAWAGFGVAPLLVVFIRNRIAASEKLASQLRVLEIERDRIAERDSARAALARVEANYRAVGESIPFGIWQTDVDGNLLYVSESFRELTGMSLEELQKGGWLRLVPPEDADRFLRRWAERDSGSDIWEGEYRLRGADGQLYAILSRGIRLKDGSGKTTGWAGVSLDITRRKRAVDALALLEEVGRQLVLSLDPPVILERVAAACVARIADWCSIDMVDEDGHLANVTTLHRDPAIASLAAELRAYPVDPDGGQASVVKSGQPQLYPTITDEMLVGSAKHERHLALLRQVGVTSAMIVPLLTRRRVIGTLTLATSDSGRRYDKEDLGVAVLVGVRTALAFENAQHYAREVRVADTLQRASLPSELPQLPGIRISATYLPGANESEIGGDWYDAFLLPGGEIGITIGDVAGKGLHAAVAMGMVRQALRGAALDNLSPASALKRVNRHLCHEGTRMVTAVAASIDPTTNVMRYASAGHPPIVIASIDGTMRTLKASGIPLGLSEDAAYVEGEALLKLGDLVVLYTDGLIEFDRDVAQGERILAEAASAEAIEPSSNPAVSIQHRVFSGQPKDDIAVLTVSISAQGIEELDVEAPAVPSSARTLRQALRRLAIAAGLSESRIFQLLVAAGEAISNAIEHAYGVEDGTIRVRGMREDGRLVIVISDRGGWRRPREEGRGRGIPLMRSIVDSADVESDESGTTVRLAMALSESRR